MAVSTRQPVDDPADLDEAARVALRGRRELHLLEDPSVLAMARMLVERCRDAAPWVRAAVATLDRFDREVALGDLPGLLAAGRADPAEADRSLQRLARRHDGLSAGQMASLAFGPKLWWTVAGVPVRADWIFPATEVRSAGWTRSSHCSWLVSTSSGS